jgi:hypothetical protein
VCVVLLLSQLSIHYGCYAIDLDAG